MLCLIGYVLFDWISITARTVLVFFNKVCFCFWYFTFRCCFGHCLKLFIRNLHPFPCWLIYFLCICLFPPSPLLHLTILTCSYLHPSVQYNRVAQTSLHSRYATALRAHAYHHRPKPPHGAQHRPLRREHRQYDPRPVRVGRLQQLQGDDSRGFRHGQADGVAAAFSSDAEQQGYEDVTAPAGGG